MKKFNYITYIVLICFLLFGCSGYKEDKSIKENNLVKNVAQSNTSNMKKVDYNSPFIDYSDYKDNITNKNYSFLYEENDIKYMYQTMGKGHQKQAYIVNQYDIEDMKKGLISDADLNHVACTNYIFDNIIHSVYIDGDAIFVIICNTNTNSLKVYGRIKNNNVYSSENEFNLLGINEE